MTERTPEGRHRFATFLAPPKDPPPPKDIPAEVWRSISLALGGSTFALERWKKKKPDKAAQIDRIEMYLRQMHSLLASGAAADEAGFVGWMEDRLKAKDCEPGITLKDFPQKTLDRGVQLSVVASDLTAQKLLVLNHHTAPDVPVVQAVRMSMGIPLIWKEVEWKGAWGKYRDKTMREGDDGHRIVDGGLLSNFPLKFLLDPTRSKPTGILGPPPDDRGVRKLGLLLDEAKEPPMPIAKKKAERFAERLPLYKSISRLVDTTTSAWDWEAIEENDAGKYVCRIGVKDVDTLDFDMDEGQLKALLDSGRHAMAEHLKNTGG
jgi:predicted acylesterase/phospholipase RssA